MAETVAIEKNNAYYGKSEYGCEHYRRRCRIRAPCCDRVFTCRHCHNEATSLLRDPKAQHEIVRHEVKRVICAVCDTEQEVAQVCTKCGVNMGEYFCGICKFYDDDTEKGQFHCEECGICRVGGRENFFHCPKCGSCYPTSLHGNHSCVENSMKNQCPVCLEYLFDSVKSAQVLKCGHTIHIECFKEMTKQDQYRCPMCFKSAMDMDSYWKMLDDEIAETSMPEEYRKEVNILCNDCHATGKAPFHIFGLKCSRCSSYNTRRTGAAPQEENLNDLSSTTQ